MDNRPSWDSYFLGIARAVAARGDCSRRQVGAIVVRERRIVASGYNGTPPGGASCLKGECPRAQTSVDPGSSYDTGPGACIATHAEANAVIYAGYMACRGSVMYVTDKPCDGCMKMIRAAQLGGVIYGSVEASGWISATQSR